MGEARDNVIAPTMGRCKADPPSPSPTLITPAISSKTTATSRDSQARRSGTRSNASFVQRPAKQTVLPCEPGAGTCISHSNTPLRGTRCGRSNGFVVEARVVTRSRFGNRALLVDRSGVRLSLLGVSEVVTEGKGVLDTGMLFVVRLRKVQGCASKGS